ncbi:hypothetical protein Lal_00021585 [Lupinus albus]|nr:hypothetical protein Lal_00021585 [Lupinus albus]
MQIAGSVEERSKHVITQPKRVKNAHIKVGDRQQCPKSDSRLKSEEGTETGQAGAWKSHMHANSVKVLSQNQLTMRGVVQRIDDIYNDNTIFTSSLITPVEALVRRINQIDVSLIPKEVRNQEKQINKLNSLQRLRDQCIVNKLNSL